jgi:hypothetical protein
VNCITIKLLNQLQNEKTNKKCHPIKSGTKTTFEMGRCNINNNYFEITDNTFEVSTHLPEAIILTSYLLLESETDNEPILLDAVFVV